MLLKKISYLWLIIVLAVFMACNKDKYTTKPQLKLKSISPNGIVQSGNILSFEIEFSDAEGDVQNTIWVKRISKVCPEDIKVKPDSISIPDFESTKNQKGVFQFKYIYNVLKSTDGTPIIGGCQNNIRDTSIFKFWMVDKANNYSDTVTTPYVVFEAK